MTQMIDGKALAAKLQGQLAEKTAKLKEETGLVPGLVVILVVKSCEFLGPLLKRNC